jgi:peptide/nickel transport system permease protein
MKKTLARWLDSDVGHSFRTSPVAMVAAAIALVCIFCSVFAGWVAPHDPFNLSTLELSDARLPPAWSAQGSSKYLLGTDDQGRDILSALMYGARISLVVGCGLRHPVHAGRCFAGFAGGLSRRLD